MKKIAFVCSSLLILLALGEVRAQDRAGEGDYVIVTKDGSDTYTVKINGKPYQCYRHGRISSGFIYHTDPARGWTYAEPGTATARKFVVPSAGDIVYVITNRERLYKAKVTGVGGQAYDKQKLYLSVEFQDGEQVITTAAGHYATEAEYRALGWPEAGKVEYPEVAAEVLRKIEAEALAAMNEARTRPSEYADRLAAQFKTKSAIVEETIRFLKNVGAQSDHPFAGLTRDVGLDQAALEHAVDAARNPNSGHQGTSQDCSQAPNNGWVQCRIARHGQWSGLFGESMFLGFEGHPYDGSSAVATLMIDHGVPSRGHRANFFDLAQFTPAYDGATGFRARFTKVGIGCAFDKTTGAIVTVLVFANEFTPRQSNESDQLRSEQ